MPLTRASSVGSSSLGEGSDLWIYGHSFTQAPGLACTVGQEFYNRLKARRLFKSVTTYGVGSSRMADITQDLINQAVRTPMTGSAWAGTRRGAVVLDCIFNDAYNANATVTTQADALSAQQVTDFAAALTTALAILTSSGRVEVESGTKSGTWAADIAQTRYSGGTLTHTSTDGASIAVPVTVPAAGYVWLLVYGVATGSTAGALTVTEGGTTNASKTTAQMQVASIFSKRATAAPENALPIPIKITATPGAHTFTITKTGNDSGHLYADCFLLPHTSPVPIAVLKDPQPQPGGSNSASTTANRAVMAANTPLLNAQVDSVCTGFPTVTVIDPALGAAGTGYTDGVHPNDRGMRQMTDALIAAPWLSADADGAYSTL